MKPSERDGLLMRLDERTSHLYKAVMGLYGIWGVILVSALGAVVWACK